MNKEDSNRVYTHWTVPTEFISPTQELKELIDKGFLRVTTPNGFKMLVVLDQLADDQGVAVVDQTALANASGMNLTQRLKALKDLEYKGLLQVQGGNILSATGYKLTSPTEVLEKIGEDDFFNY